MILSKEFFIKQMAITLDAGFWVFLIAFPFLWIGVFFTIKTVIVNVLFLLLTTVKLGLVMITLPAVMLAAMIETKQNAFKELLFSIRNEGLNLGMTLAFFGLFFGLVAKQLFEIFSVTVCYQDWWSIDMSIYKIAMKSWVPVQSKTSSFFLLFKIAIFTFFGYANVKIVSMIQTISNIIVGPSGGIGVDLNSANDYFDEVSSVVKKFMPNKAISGAFSKIDEVRQKNFEKLSKLAREKLAAKKRESDKKNDPNINKAAQARMAKANEFISKAKEIAEKDLNASDKYLKSFKSLFTSNKDVRAARRQNQQLKKDLNDINGISKTSLKSSSDKITTILSNTKNEKVKQLLRNALREMESAEKELQKTNADKEGFVSRDNKYVTSDSGEFVARGNNANKDSITNIDNSSDTNNGITKSSTNVYANNQPAQMQDVSTRFGESQGVLTRSGPKIDAGNLEGPMTKANTGLEFGTEGVGDLQKNDQPESSRLDELAKKVAEQKALKEKVEERAELIEEIENYKKPKAGDEDNW
jgi:hypothetical protein